MQLYDVRMDTTSRAGGSERRSVALSGRLDRSHRAKFAPWIQEARAAGAKELCFDLGSLQGFDSLGVASLVEAIGWGREQGIAVKLRNLSPSLREYLDLLDIDNFLQPAKESEKELYLAHLGRITYPFLDSFRAQFLLFGQTIYWSVVGPFRGKPLRWDRTAREVGLVGIDAIPIVLLIATLMGIILTMQSATQLRQYGATILIADLVGISITRELGPLLTAIIVAGRSGSANAAEIGTMVVSEELDAIRQMGVNPTRFLFVPKILSLAISLPCLAIMANMVGILASAIIASASFGLSMGAYFEESRQALLASDLFFGLFKAMVFGVIIGATGCAQGMTVRGGAGEVGRATTVAVVVSIFFIIAADTIFAWVVHLS